MEASMTVTTIKGQRNMKTVRGVLLGVVTASGFVACLVSGYYVLQDWAALNIYYARFEELTMSNASMRSLFIAEAHQNVFRINCFADGVGVLLGAILAAIGLHGLLAAKSVDSDKRSLT
jgi:hypothetical protein